MAFNATTVLNRYSTAGPIPVLKVDFTNLAADLIALETFAATSVANAGKWSKLQLAEVTTTPATNIQLFHLDTNGHASSTDTGKWSRLELSSDVAVTPATNITLFHLNTNGYASTVDNGKWKQLILGPDLLFDPPTNIQLFHINTGGYASTAGVPGSWKQFLVRKTNTPGTNIGISDLKRSSVAAFVTGIHSFPVSWRSMPTSPSVGDQNAVPFWFTSSTVDTDDGNFHFYRVGLTGRSDNLSTNITFGGICKITALQIGGNRTLNATFNFFGINFSGVSFTYAVDTTIYKIEE